MATAIVNGLSIHYRDTGGDGFPVVLAHGYTGNSRNWALAVPVLRQEFRVISPDHRGHGMSGRPMSEEEYSLDSLADDLWGLLVEIGVEKCYLVGHSMGGMVSQLLTLKHPELVSALVLVDTAAELSPEMRAQSRYEERNQLMVIAREHGMEAVFEAHLRANQDPRIADNAQFVAVWREQFLLTSREAYIGCAHGMFKREPLVSRLSEISVPALVVCGAGDEPFLEASRVMHANLPASELAIIDGAGHTPQIEAPAAFNEVLMGFLTRAHSRAASPA